MNIELNNLSVKSVEFEEDRLIVHCVDLGSSQGFIKSYYKEDYTINHIGKLEDKIKDIMATGSKYETH